MGDDRDVKTLEQLENGHTGDAIWDAMQRQLQTHGTAPSCLSGCCPHVQRWVMSLPSNVPASWS